MMDWKTYDDLEYSETADYWREKADRQKNLLEASLRIMKKYNFPTMIPLIKAIEKELSDGYDSSD